MSPELNNKWTHYEHRIDIQMMIYRRTANFPRTERENHFTRPRYRIRANFVCAGDNPGCLVCNPNYPPPLCGVLKFVFMVRKVAELCCASSISQNHNQKSYKKKTNDEKDLRMLVSMPHPIQTVVNIEVQVLSQYFLGLIAIINNNRSPARQWSVIISCDFPHGASFAIQASNGAINGVSANTQWKLN